MFYFYFASIKYEHLNFVKNILVKTKNIIAKNKKVILYYILNHNYFPINKD